MNFAPIHNHSEYSALDGLSTCREIAERCKCIGCQAAGITDHMTVAGHLEFAREMDKHGIKPIFGCEFYHGVKTEFGKQERDQAHFVAGAMTDEGLKNLWRLVDDSSTNYRFVSRVNWDMLRKHSEGLFATSACISGLVAQGVLHTDPYPFLDKYLNIFKDNFYIEIHTYPGEDHQILNRGLVQIARERGIPLIYATDAHFADPDQYELHDAYVAMQTGDTVYTDIEDRKMWHPKSLYIQDEEQIRESLSYLPTYVIDEALTNSAELADKCNAQLPEVKRHLPAFIPKDCPWLDPEDRELQASELYIRLIEEGIYRRYDDPSDEVWKRTVQEIEVFLNAGLEHYFLQAWDFCEFCNRNDIKRGPGRGSAAGAIVAYALGITDVNPLKYGLIFERFYNPGREDGYPDIDNDFPVKERKRVREYLMQRWGRDKVRTIGTVRRMKPKAVIDKTYKAFDISWDDKELLKKIVDNVPDIDILGNDSIGWRKSVDPGKTIYVEDHVGDEIEKFLDVHTTEEQEVLRYWIECIAELCARVDGYGVHPSGVIVSDVPLAEETPSLYNRQQDVQVTCFAMADVDKRLFVKQDLLGLNNLDILQEWEDLLKAQIDDFSINWSDLDDGPEEMWQQLDQGFTLGVFQIESGYARQLCKEFKPRSIEDLGIIVSLNRPGPIRSGAPESFIKRRRGEEEVTYDHPILEDILEPTYGWFLYQEQVIRFFAKIGYSESDADAVRKILGKKKPEQMVALYEGSGEWEGHGYMTMAESAGIPVDIANVIWKKLEDFAKYSFNKSHAICYATIAFRTLFAKYYGLAEFIISCIRKNPDSAGLYVSEGRRKGISVLPPNITHSREDITNVNGDIYFGFSNVKNIGLGTGKFIIELREKYDVSTPELLHDALEAEQAIWEANKKLAKEEGRSFKQKSPRQTLRSNQIPMLFDAGAWDDYVDREISLSDRQKKERELLGVIITDNCDEIFENNQDTIRWCDSYLDLEKTFDEKLYIPGAIATINPKKTKKDGKAMGIITIEYRGDQAEMVVFPREWMAYKFLWKERTPGIFCVVKTERGLRFESAELLT